MMRYFLILFFAASLFGAPIGNPSAPALLEEGFFIPDTSWSNLQTGYTQDFLLQKRVKPQHKTTGPSVKHAIFWGTSQLGEIAWSIRERFNLQADLGSSQFQWKWKRSGKLFEGDSDYGFYWGGNAKLILLEMKDTSLAIDGQAGGCDQLHCHLTINGEAQPQAAKLRVRFWQAGAALTQKIGPFAPYFGWIANQTNFKVSRLPTGPAWLQSQIVSGPFAGCTITNGSRFFLNVEWRGWFEQGISISGQLRF